MSHVDLGPAEQHVANELRELIDACKKHAGELVELFDAIDVERIEEGIQNPKNRKALIGIVGPLRNLSQNLTTAQLVAIVLDVLTKPREPTE